MGFWNMPHLAHHGGREGVEASVRNVSVSQAEQDRLSGGAGRRRGVHREPGGFRPLGTRSFSG